VAPGDRCRHINDESARVVVLEEWRGNGRMVV